MTWSAFATHYRLRRWAAAERRAVIETNIHTVFLSSTFEDLKGERRALIDALLRRDLMPLGMEFVLSTQRSVLETVLERLDRASICVVLIAGRYGTVPEGGELSWTHREYREARARGIPVVVVVHDDPESLPAELRDTDEQLVRRLQAFREEATREEVPAHFSDLGQLVDVVTASVGEAIARGAAEPWSRRSTAAARALPGQADVLGLRRRRLVELLQLQYGREEGLQAVGYSLMPPRPTWRDTEVHISAEVGQDRRPWQVTSTTFTALFDEPYVVAVSGSRSASDYLLAECFGVHDVFSLAESVAVEELARALTETITVELFTLRSSGRPARPQPQALTPVTGERRARLLSDLSPEQADRVVLAEVDLRGDSRDAVRVRTTFRARFGPDSLYTYWRADRVLHVRSISFDLGQHPDCREEPLVSRQFLGSATAEEEPLSSSALRVPVEGWVLPGQGVLVAFR